MTCLTFGAFTEKLQSKVCLHKKCPVRWYLQSYAEQQNVKLHLFGYSLGPSVITLNKPKTMFLVQTS